jgi:ABC-type sugar transport system permease subunit
VVDGGNGWHKLLHITLPLLPPTIFFNGVMAIIGSLQVFTQGYVMTQGGPNNATLVLRVLSCSSRRLKRPTWAMPARWRGSCS